MSRLVVVSNRVADPRKPAAGGLAVALGEALKQTGGLWFGWSGTIVEDGPAGDGEFNIQQVGKVTLATVDLSAADHAGYYLGYSNSVLWPVFHYRLDLARFDTAHTAAYRRVNRLFAATLLPLLRPDDLVWIHDYHLIPLAAELRAAGCTNRIGFFLHIPLPPRAVMLAIPESGWLIRCLFAYDLVGFQSGEDLRHFTHYVQAETGADVLGGRCLRAFNRTLHADVFPIGIDVDDFKALVQSKEGRDMYERTRHDFASRRLLVGVDRLDYSKGLPLRMRAFKALLQRHPENMYSATLLQIASPSREDLCTYAGLLRELESLSGSINGDFGTLDWMPIRYVHRNMTRKRLAGLYRAANVALVTPLRDGMNLVAKEYIAAQDPDDPGALVLSRFAGAAEQLPQALLVNPYDVDGTADTIQQALNMPLGERQERHRDMLRNVTEQDVHWWCTRYLDALAQARLAPSAALDRSAA